MINSVEKAGVLIEALPYFQQFAGKTIVVKYGGNAMLNEEIKKSVIQDIVLMQSVGIRVVVVHGGGPEITALLKQLGKKSEFIAGLRVTDAETVEAAEMVLVGKVNTDIVNLLNRHGAKAVGLNGKDADLIIAHKHLATVYENSEAKQVDIGLVGDVTKINSAVVNTLLDCGYLPVIAPIGVGADGATYNINADYVAGEVAGALAAEKLLLLTDVEGVYRDYKDKSTFISTLSFEEADQMVKTGSIDGGMIPKVDSCVRALTGGAAKAHIIDGRLPHSLLLEIFTEKGIGTEVVGLGGGKDE